MSRMPVLSSLEALERSLPTSPLSASRLRASLSSGDPLELVRRIVQKDLNQKIESLFQEYIKAYFRPAAKNVEANLGVDTSDLLEQTCINALEHAKSLFRGKGGVLKRPLLAEEGAEPEQPLKKVPKDDNWRFNAETLFVLGSSAGRALGFHPGGKLYASHPGLFKYAADSEDKEWLVKELLVSTSGGKAFLIALEDVLALGYEGPEQLRGFTVPESMLSKIQTAFLCGKKPKTDLLTSPSVVPPAPVEDELGFLHGMNLTSLVREFEMEAGDGSQHLGGILSLADDTESFSELSNEVQENMESFESIEFN